MPQATGLQAVVEHCAPYWAGEYAVAHRYFTSGRRTQQSETRWLELQMFKEWTGSGVYGDRSVTVTGVVQKGLDALRKIEAGGAVEQLGSISELLQFGLDEFNHFRMLYELYRRVAPERQVAIADMGGLPEARRLVEMRYQYREQEPLGDVIVDLTEGGGLGMYFGISHAFEELGVGGKEDELVLAFARATVRDETEHMSHRFRNAAGLDLTAEQWTRVERGLLSLFTQKLRERNQQFGDVFTQPELDEKAADLDAGRRYVERNLSFLSAHLQAA